jgi:hypothetical protein
MHFHVSYAFPPHSRHHSKSAIPPAVWTSDERISKAPFDVNQKTETYSNSGLLQQS